MNRIVPAAFAPICAGVLLCAPLSNADPAEPAIEPQPVAAGAIPAPAPGVPGPEAGGPAPEAGGPAPEVTANPVADACKLFNAALNVAAANYEDFAYATAGNGNYVNYQDPNVGRTNVVGRTALRQAAAAALSASRTPGLPPEAADPMRSWSLHATKLVLVMGLHGGGDTLNSAVAELNTEGHDAQMACALAASRG